MEGGDVTVIPQDIADVDTAANIADDLANGRRVKLTPLQLAQLAVRLARMAKRMEGK